MADGMGREDPGFRPRIVAYACENSAYAAADLCGANREALPEGFTLIRVPCTGRVDVLHVLRALESGADGVLVLGCVKDGCKFLRGNLRAEKRVLYASDLLRQIGIEPERVSFHEVGPGMSEILAAIVREAEQSLRALGPNRGKVIA